jgi:nucleoside-triphosphatase
VAESDRKDERRHVLITGSPGVGKTTLIASLVVRLPGTTTGLLTREVRESGVRKGFTIETLDGEHARLAEVSSSGACRVGKYRVLTESIRDVAVPAILRRADFIVIDEIGKMETLSEDFVRAVHTVLAGPSVVIATIAAGGNAIIEEIRLRRDVRLFEVTRANRNSLADAILEHVRCSRADNGRR